MKKLIVWGLLIITAMGSLVEARVLKFPTGDYPDLRSAVNAAVVGDTIQQIEPGDFSDGLQINGRGMSFIGLGSALCTIHFEPTSGYAAMFLGDYPIATEIQGFSLVGTAVPSRDISGLEVLAVQGSSIQIRDILIDCSWDGIGIWSNSGGNGQVLIDHLTVKGHYSGAGVNVVEGHVEIRNSVFVDGGEGIAFTTLFGATLSNHDNLFDSCYPVYYDEATAGTGEFEGTANLNDRNVPIPISDALNRATPDSTDLGALQFDWTQLGDLHFMVDGQRIAGPPHMYTPGDDLALDVQLTHNVPGYVNLVTYVVLSVAGEFYFWPNWQQFESSDPSTIDSSTVEFHTGDIAEVLHCTLPESGWSAPFTVDFYALGAFPGTEFTPATELATVQFTFGV